MWIGTKENKKQERDDEEGEVEGDEECNMCHLGYVEPLHLVIYRHLQHVNPNTLT